MVNPEEVLQSLDEFSKVKPKDIPRELEEYLMYVAKTGDPVYQWSLVKCLFREKMLSVITDFYESCPSIDLPPCPNVDSFNYETMKANLLERLESFSNAPFTVQRLCELLTTPRKEYTRVDKFMRAIEKNILVVSTKEPGGCRARPDVPPQQPQQADVLMNGVMDGRGAGGLDIGEAIETVSAEGVNLMQSSEAVAEAAEVSLADTIRVECEDIEMDDSTAATVVWDPKPGDCAAAADGLKNAILRTAAAAAAAAAAATAEGDSPANATVVWDSKTEECGAVNGEGLKGIDATPETSITTTNTPNTTIVWDTKEDAECGEGLKTLSPTPDSSAVDVSAATTSKAVAAEDEHEAAAVAVVSEFLAPNREVFGQSLGAGVEAVPLVLAGDPDSEERVTAGVSLGVSIDCSISSPDISAIINKPVPDVDEQQQDESAEAESKDAAESKESESEDTSPTDIESGISCSAGSSSVSSDCATAEINQTLETNGTLEITSVESDVMSPLEGLEDVTANISPPSPDDDNLDDSENIRPPTFAEMTADEDTQDAVRSSDPLDDDSEEELSDSKSESGTKIELELEPTPTPESTTSLETKMEVDEAPAMDEGQSDEPVVEQCVMDVADETVKIQSPPTSQDETAVAQADTSEMPYNIV